MKIEKFVTHRAMQVVALKCDSCGISSADEHIIQIVISVDEDEEGGSRDEFEYCFECFVGGVKDNLLKAGSTAPVVTGYNYGDLL
jgi:hypothetical protein